VQSPRCTLPACAPGREPCREAAEAMRSVEQNWSQQVRESEGSTVRAREREREREESEGKRRLKGKCTDVLTAGKMKGIQLLCHRSFAPASSILPPLLSMNCCAKLLLRFSFVVAGTRTVHKQQSAHVSSHFSPRILVHQQRNFTWNFFELGCR
jgi:hypothetical protein